MKVKDETKYNDAINNSIDYVTVVVEYAEYWAEVMEANMKDDKLDINNSIEVDKWVSENSDKIADSLKYSVSSFVFEYAKKLLAAHWAYGEYFKNQENKSLLCL